MILTEFIESNYWEACKMQHNIQEDVKMKDMLDKRSIDKVLVQSWMTDYKLFQGIKSDERNAIVDKYASVVFDITENESVPDRNKIEKMFQKLLSAFYESVPRKWLSATSKLLWCSFPNQVAIYDRFVEKALLILQCTEPYLANLPRIGVSPGIKSEADIKKVVLFYMNYQDIVKAILSEYQDLLTDLRNKHQENYPHDIRIIDKLLWMMGNPSYEFKPIKS